MAVAPSWTAGPRLTRSAAPGGGGHQVLRLLDDAGRPLAGKRVVALTVRARPGRLSALSVFPRKSVFYGAFVWARRAPNRKKTAVLRPRRGQWTDESFFGQFQACH